MTPGEALARAALERYGLARPARLTFIRHGENTTYRVDDADGRAFALRLHRPGYQTADSIRSEVAWMDALRSSGVRTPEAVPGADGDVVQRVTADGERRLAAVFTWVEGVALDELDRLDLWRVLGELIGTVHAHGAGWPRPAGFVRHAWDLDGMLGAEPHWGDPRRLGTWTPAEDQLLAACQEATRRRLTGFGSGPDRFGLIHADLAFANVLVTPDGDAVLIDFDDSGTGWFLYDLAVPLFPYEDSPDFAARRAALVAGYRTRHALPDELLTELPTFLMARRLVTLGWTYSHGETEHAQRQRAWRLRTFPAAARRFLDWAGAYSQ